MLRLGLCCLFKQAPIRYRRTTAKTLLRLERPAQLERLGQLGLENARALLASLEEVRRLGIGAFRVLSPLLPLYTHPEVGYRIDELPTNREILATLESVKNLKQRYRLRLSFHPDQFTLLSSPREEVTVASLRELDYHALLAELIGAEVINLHGGGAYGDKPSSLKRLEERIRTLPEAVRSRLTLENDDRTYTVADLQPLCERLSVPLVYDVHHHRCNPDGLTIKDATAAAIATWEKREPYFHLSSPKHGWDGAPQPHADFIDIADFPAEWKSLPISIDVEAKAKELAVLKLQRELGLPPWREQAPEDGGN